MHQNFSASGNEKLHQSEGPIGKIFQELKNNPKLLNDIPDAIVQTAEEQHLAPEEIFFQIKRACADYWINFNNFLGFYVDKRPESLGELLKIFQKRKFTIENESTVGGVERPFYGVIGPDMREYYIPSKVRHKIDPIAEHYLTIIGEQALDIDPERDYYFAVAADAIVIVSESEAEPQYFFARLSHPKNNSWQAALVQNRVTREDIHHTLQGIVEGLGPTEKDSGHKAYMQALAAAPDDGTANLAPLRPWGPDIISEQLAGESDEHYKTRCAKIIDPQKFYELHHALAAEVPSYPPTPAVALKSLWLFLSFYQTLDDAQRRRIQLFLTQAGSEQWEFLNVFQTCEVHWEMANKIMDLEAHNPEATAILAYHQKLITLRDKIFWGNPGEIIFTLGIRIKNVEQILTVIRLMRDKVDHAQFYAVMEKKGAQIVAEGARGATLKDLTEKFNLEKILRGAIFSSIAVNKAVNLPDQTDAIETLIQGMEIDFVEGESGMIRNPEAMEDPNNYPYANRFNLDNYHDLKSFLETAYTKIDPGWLAYLIRNIPHDLTNETCGTADLKEDEKVRFVTIKMEGILVGIAKIKPSDDPEDPPGTWYFGTHYVASELKKDYGVGNFMQKLAFSFMPEGARVVATVAIANEATERHIEKNGIGLKVTFEGDEISQSKELIKFCWNYEGTYTSKSFDRKKIIDEAQAITSSEDLLASEESSVKIFQLNAAHGENDLYIQACKRFLDSGDYVMTRFFTDPQEGMKKAYVVFERSAESKKDLTKPEK